MVERRVPGIAGKRVDHIHHHIHQNRGDAGDERSSEVARRRCWGVEFPVHLIG
jgi:hypothetical protein